MNDDEKFRLQVVFFQNNKVNQLALQLIAVIEIYKKLRTMFPKFFSLIMYITADIKFPPSDISSPATKITTLVEPVSKEITLRFSHLYPVLM